jgi:pantoate--beta-alanine ligase
VTSIDSVRQAVRQARGKGLTIGLVPTMGALHEGHASLLRAARLETGFVVASIFVNPTQFGPNEDLARYPRSLNADLLLCGREGVALVFAPERGIIYPEGFHTYIEVHDLQDVLCGASRPGHFRGVATVVLKLFNIVQPDIAYFGQKDAQQARIITQMVRDLDVPVQVRIGSIVREKDGLAQSSRNRYLSHEERRAAGVLFRALTEARVMIEQGEREASQVERRMAGLIEATPGATLDYAAAVDAGTLQRPGRLRGKILLALAVRFGGTRLIDNLLVDVAD